MAGDHLSALDTSFLEVETPTAHMHVGWGSIFTPADRGAPSFRELRDHIAGRLARAPRYRQRLAPVPLGVSSPVWVDDEDFDISNHVKRAHGGTFSDVIDAAMSEPLDHRRPLWELWIADRLEDGRLGVVGKAHHCMVDGLAAVELAALLLDPTADPPPPETDDWHPAPAPGAAALLATGVRARAEAALRLATLPARLALSPGRLLGMPRATGRAGRALADAVRPAPSQTPLNAPISPRRHLARAARPLEDLREVKRAFRASINDVVLAVAAGGLRRYLERKELVPAPFKAMVPVSVRADEGGAFGNRLSFVFVDLPCEEPEPARRLLEVKREMGERKAAGEPEGAEEVLKALEYAPRTLQAAASRLAARPEAFNLVVSNIPGPREKLYMLGCELVEAYPVVPLADRHALSIGMTTVQDDAFFGIYADPVSVPDADLLAGDIDESVDELLSLAAQHGRSRPARHSVPSGTA